MTSCILITVDCLRADHLSCFGYSKPTTSSIDSLAKDAVVFTSAFSNGPYTTTSFPSIHTSAILLRYYGENRPLSIDGTTLAEILQKNGYSTSAFHSNPYLSSRFGYARGFDYFEDFDAEPIGKEERVRGLKGQIYGFFANLNNKIMTTLEMHNMQDTLLYRTFKLLSYYFVCMIGYSGARAEGTAINEKAVSWIEKNPDRFFVWLHYMDVHSPYIPPKKYRNQFCRGEMNDYKQARILCKRNTPESFSKDEIGTLIDLYDAGVCYVDECIGDLIAHLKTMGVYEDTLIIITADHGEEFMEHGGFAHDACKLYDELLHVPLIIKLPSSSSHKILDRLCSLIDLGPTVLDVLKIPTNPNFEGASLLPILEEEETGRPYVISACGLIEEKSCEKRKYMSIRTEKWKYIFREGGEDELYNLLSDPGEKGNLIKANFEIAEKLKSKLLESSSKVHYDSSPSISADERLKMRLKALGYI